MVIALQPFLWKWISVTKVSKYGKSEYSRALNASYTFQPLMGFCWNPKALPVQIRIRIQTNCSIFLESKSSVYSMSVVFHVIHHVIAFDQWNHPFMLLTEPFKGTDAEALETKKSVDFMRNFHTFSCFLSVLQSWADSIFSPSVSLCRAVTRLKQRWPPRGCMFVAGFLNFR